MEHKSEYDRRKSDLEYRKRTLLVEYRYEKNLERKKVLKLLILNIEKVLRTLEDEVTLKIGGKYD